MSEKASREESTFGKGVGESGSPTVATRRDFLGYMGGIAVLAGLSPSGRIFEEATFGQPAPGLLMEPVLEPHVKGRTPFAVILCRFSDLPPLTIPTAVFSDYVAGEGKGGVFDYWRDISYRAIDLTGSKVFGWYTMKYSFFKEGNQGRSVWIAEAIRLASEHGVDLSPFYGVIAVVNANVDDSNDGSKNLALGIKADWGQSNWRWCNKCQGLAYGGNPPGPCPSGANHNLGGYDYALAINMPDFPGQNNWRWCKKCGGLAYAGNGAGHCPSGGGHDFSSSADYRLAMGKVGFPGQDNWKWCKNCQGLAYAGSSSGPGNCPAGGKHDHSSSANYTLVAPAFGYENHFDTAFGAHEMGHCFGLHRHAHCAGVTAPAPNWDYCDPWDIMGAAATFNNTASKFGRSGPGLSAGNLSWLGWVPEDRIYTAKGSRPTSETIKLAALSQPEAKGYLMARIITPDRIFTVEYRQRTRWDRGVPDDALVIHELRSPYSLGQNNWKWCGKCQGLSYAGFGAGPCPTGGKHDHSASFDYGLLHDTSDFKGQNNWRWCNKCQGLAFAGTGPGGCSAGGDHDLSRSYDYRLIMNDNSFPGQNNWRWCRRCNGLAYAGGGPGVCPGRGLLSLAPSITPLRHDHSGSADYTLLNFGTAETFLLQTRRAGERWADFQRGVGIKVVSIDTGSYTATVIV